MAARDRRLAVADAGGFRLAVLRGLTGIDFVGFDVVEVIPAYDPAGQTATLAAHLLYSMLGLVALRRSGRPPRDA